MAMEVKVNGSVYKTGYVDQMQAEREQANRMESGQEKKGQGEKTAQHDAYISSEKAGEKPNGLYHVGQDENGNKKIYFNDPKKAKRAEDSGKDGDGKSPKVNADNSDNGEEKCVGNTDNVDREIQELKEKKKTLEQQLKAASGDEKKEKELENKLAQVERELNQKDTDTYRKQHSTFTDK